MDNKTVFRAYMAQFGGFLPIQEYVVEDFFKAAPLLRTCEDLKYVVNLLSDYVGSTQAYEEGSEEAW